MNISDASDAQEASSASTPSRKRKCRDEGTADLGAHMILTQEERQWALALKEALLQDVETKQIPVSDMEIAQFAMVEMGNVAKAKERIINLNEFRARYQIEETGEHGVECLKAFIEQQPGFLLNVDQCAKHKHFVQVMDFAKFYPGKVQLDKDWKVFLSGMHYISTAMNPTLAASRNGLVAIMECEGMGWDNFSIDFERRLWAEFAASYPLRFHEVSWVRTPTAANMFFSLLKPIMSKEIRRVCRLGVQLDECFDGRLDELFLQPNLEAAVQKQLSTLQSYLATRYHNQLHFRL